MKSLIKSFNYQIKTTQREPKVLKIEHIDKVMTTSTIKRRRSTNMTTSVEGVPFCSRSPSDSDSWITYREDHINPFTHRLRINSRLAMIKIYILTVVLLPLRLIGCFLSLCCAWVFAKIGMIGLSEGQLNAKPLFGWRKRVQKISAFFMRMLYACGSFHYIRYKGKCAAAKDAPILVVAPHSSYVDSIIVAATGPPAIVAKQETSNIPLLGKIITFAQPIYVQREDSNSRQNTVRTIVERARSEDDWSHVIIFAEGTCTNRKALIKFKPGAFYAGVPVQPVLLKYPNKYDTFTWTWDGPGALKLLWLTLSTFYNNCEIEYLPVYYPNEDEKADPFLYAENVRAVMARALGVPTSEYSFEDVVMMTRARSLNVPCSADIIEIERCLFHLDLLNSSRVLKLAGKYSSTQNRHKMDITRFSEFLNISATNAHLHKLFAILDYKHTGAISLKNFFLSALFCIFKSGDTMEFLRAVSTLYASGNTDQLTHEQFLAILKHCDKLSKKKLRTLYLRIAELKAGNRITFDDFENYTRNHEEYKFLFKKHEHIKMRLKK
uniref:Phospholipid/glycerol acyltransferase domain-containing protein n=1 Tax=Glossina pallidipes TaxID=7398 RepID=A0A1B0AIX0_GLOPL